MTNHTNHFACQYCEEIYLELTSEYMDKNPNASEVYIEQQFNKHLEVCSSVQSYEYTCRYCNEVYARMNPGYVASSPNASDTWRDQMYQEHLDRECPAYE